MSKEPDLSLDEAKAVVATKTAPRVTEEAIKAKIASVEYARPFNNNKMTLCVITMANGFMALGKSAPVSEANFDAQVGEYYAYEDAFKQLWQLEAYLLLERMTRV
jgi:hypothetical protein